MSVLYENIAKLCKAKGITGYRLAKDVGISPGIISDLKFGRKKSLSADYAERIASYFGVSVAYLLGVRGYTAQIIAAIPEDSGLTKSQKALIDIAKRLTESDAEVLLAAAQALEARHTDQDEE